MSQNNNITFLSLRVFILCLFSTSVHALEAGALDCLIEPETVIEVSSSVNGIVAQMYVENSDIIRQGQALAELDSSIEKATLALAKLKAEINDEVTAKKINRTFAKSKMSRIRSLYKKKSVSSHEKDEAKTEMALAEHEYQQAKNNKRIAELEYEKAKKEVEQRKIKSPINGVVVERYVSPGELVNDRPLLKLAQIDPLKIEVIVPAELFGSILPGSKALVLPENSTDKAIEVAVKRVDRVIDASSGTFGVWLTLPNRNNKIPSGLKCKIRFLSKK